MSALKMLFIRTFRQHSCSNYLLWVAWITTPIDKILDMIMPVGHLLGTLLLVAKITCCFQGSLVDLFHCFLPLGVIGKST